MGGPTPTDTWNRVLTQAIPLSRQQVRTTRGELATDRGLTMIDPSDLGPMPDVGQWILRQCRRGWSGWLTLLGAFVGFVTVLVLVTDATDQFFLGLLVALLGLVGLFLLSLVIAVVRKA